MFAHGAVLDPDTGLIVALGKWKKRVTRVVKKLVDAIKLVRQGKYVPDREDDELSLALGESACVAPCVVLVINDNPYGLMFALRYSCRSCP